MGWISSRDTAGMERDVLLSVGRDGELMFWVPDGNGTGWRRTGRVRTGRTNIRMARCSSAKKTVLSVSPPSRITREAYVLVQLFRVQMGRNSQFGTRKSLNSHRV
jgi:hypothetical protein